MSRDAAQVARTLRAYFAFQFFSSLFLWLPVYYEIERRVGLSDREIFGINSIYQIAFCLFEIPTGLFADAWGRRRCLALGAAALTLGHAAVLVSPTYFGFLAIFLLTALGRSFISGAASAYIYDVLPELDAYRRAEGGARAWSLVGRMLGWSVVGYLMSWELLSPYAISGIAMLVACVLVGQLPAENRRERVHSVKELLARADLPGALRGMVLSPALIVVTLQGVAIFVLARMQYEVFQPVLGARGVPAESYGVILAGVSVFEAIGASRSRWVDARWGSKNSIYILGSVMAICLGLLVLPWIVASIVVLVIYSYAVGLSYPIQRSLMNRLIPESRHRATTLSLESILDRLVQALASAMLGFSLAAGRLEDFMFVVGAVFLAWLGALATTRASRSIDESSL